MLQCPTARIGREGLRKSGFGDDYSESSGSSSYTLENSDDYSADGSFSEELKGSDSSPSSEEESSDDSSEKDSDGGSLLNFHVQHSGSKKSSACGGPSLG